ncbi:hypothetical protein [Pseudooceanicola nanhaiensis]|uniref:hypothetical protein n=1 Tax=Pseudooceanicola nanhaiensis TaxID=375761 RepID=UPI004059C0C1
MDTTSVPRDAGSAPDKDAPALRMAEHADLLCWAASPTAMAVVSDLFEEHIRWQFDHKLRSRNPKGPAADGIKATIAALLGDLLAAALNHDAEGFCYRSSDRTGFKATRAESRAYEAVKSSWQALGHIEVVDGFRGSDIWDDGHRYYPGNPSSRWASRLRATPFLLRRLEGQGISPLTTGEHFRRDLDLSMPVVLKASKKGALAGRRIDFVRTEQVVRMEAEVTEINAFLSNHLFSFGPAPYLYRTFNDGDTPEFAWNLGGRFYAAGRSYLSIPKAERRMMTIDGHSVVEIDITACQLTLLHAVLETPLDLSGDPFAIEGISRDRAKQTFNVMIGLGSTTEKEGDHAPSKRRTVERALLLARYPALTRIEAEGLNSLKLQALDAEIMRDALLTLFRDHKVPALPVHDCLIVRVQDADLAEAVFAEAFKNRVGVTPRFTRVGSFSGHL